MTIRSFGDKEEETFTYYNFEVTLKPIEGTVDPIILNEYGWFIDNGMITAVCRGPRGSGEVYLSVPSENVWYVKNKGVASLSQAFNA